MKTDIANRLIVEISSGLHSTELHKNCIVARETIAPWCKTILEWLPTEIQDNLLRFCGGTGFTSFIRSELSRKVEGVYEYDGAASKRPILSLPEFPNATETAKRLVAKMKGIPYRYRVTVGLPRSFSTPIIDYFEPIELNKETFLYRGDGLPSPFPVCSDEPAIQRSLFQEPFGTLEYEDEIISDRIYLSTTLLGYDSAEGTAILARSIEDNLRAFYGAAKALNLLGWNSVTEPKPLMAMIHEESPERKIVGTEEIESDLWSSNTRFGTTAFSRTDETMRKEMVQRQFSYVKEAFGEEIASKRLFTACIWHFRAWSSSRPLDQLLESTIAMEVILGDRDTSEGIGLSKLIGNRCAYMLGKTATERDQIQADFRKLYKLRSSIVHIGKHRADTEDTKVVGEAVKLSGRIIRHELRSLADSRKAI